MKRELDEEESSRKKGLTNEVLPTEEDVSSEGTIDSEDSEEDVVLEDDLNEELEQKMNDLKVYLPGVEMDKDEELVVDKTTYELLHAMNVEWPCLSFDILKDKLGNDRTAFPMTSYIAAGSQAETGQNKVYVMKMSNMYKTKNDDDSDCSDDEDNDQDAVLEYKMIPHESCVNRLRAMPHPEVHIIATMAETGRVHILDISQQVASFDTPGLIPPKDPKPIHSITNHGAYEGYAIDWSSLSTGSLLTGDGRGRIFLTKKDSAGFTTEKKHFIGHTSSVEDIQWSPSQANVFASCSADQTICIWDLRTRNKAQLSIKAHDSDVNVISWNKKVDYLLASGSDSGQFSIWDLRNWPSAVKLKNTPETAACFSWHTQPITSIEWNPNESSVLSCAGADDQLTIWDLALERDEEDEILMGTNASGVEIEVPPQLLFIHQGQNNVKETHWHPQAPGVVVSTAADGFNIFKTFNM